MKRFKIILFLMTSFLMCSSCTNIIFFDYSKDDLMGLHHFLNRENFNYRTAGTYQYKGETLIENYTIDDKYNLYIVKINNVAANSKLSVNGNQPFEIVSSTYTILENYNYELNYNLYGLSKIREKTSLHFSSDGPVNKLKSNDTLSVYSTYQQHLTLYFNDNPEVRMYTELVNANIKALTSDIAFYRKGNDVYLLIFTSATGKNIEQGTLLNYISI